MEAPAAQASGKGSLVFGCWRDTQKSGESYLLTGQVLLELLQLFLLAFNLQLHLGDWFREASATRWCSLDRGITTALAIFVWPNYVFQGALSFVRVPSKLEGESRTSDAYIKAKKFLSKLKLLLVSLEITLRGFGLINPWRKQDRPCHFAPPHCREYPIGLKPAESPHWTTLYRRLQHEPFKLSWDAQGDPGLLISTHLFLAQNQNTMNAFKK